MAAHKDKKCKTAAAAPSTCCGASREIEVIARGVCIKGGRLLLCHSKGAPNTYLPGGHVEFGEDARESLRREMEEEMGLPFTVGRFLGVVEHAYKRKGEPQHEVNLVFEMTCRSLGVAGQPQSREDYIEFLWVPQAELGTAGLEPHPLRKLVKKWASSPAGPGWASTM
ncbi:MAG: NUDIX domain-containing protein [bacterium]